MKEKHNSTEDAPFTLKFVFISVVLYAILLLRGGSGIAVPLLKKIVGGGVEQGFILIVYWGLILLVGYIGFCTYVLGVFLWHNGNKSNSNRKDDEES